ncbi:MAG: hypothetical protein KAS11_00650 [Candidatus Aenigmarchaeota archaeon]|nr:hypothetical protein [Candidatus Aenigmarchaeota archaeon]
MNVFTIALSKGELGKSIEKYLLDSYGINVDIGSKPVLTQDYGNICFRIVNSRDAAKYLGRFWDFAITGYDNYWDESLYRTIEGIKNIKIISELGVDKGSIKVIGSQDTDIESLKKYNWEKTIVAVSSYYENIARWIMEMEYRFRESNYELLTVLGATEGYVSRGEADLAIDSVFSGNSVDRNNLKVVDDVIETESVLLSTGRYSFKDFDALMQGNQI